MLSSQNCRLATASSPSARFQTTTYRALSVKKHWLTVAMLAGPPMSHTLNSTDSTLALEPAGLWSSHLVVLMVASLCAIWGALPVCKISRRVDLPWRGGPTTIIFMSLHFSAFRS